MSERRWEPVYWCEDHGEWESRYDRPPHTDAEVLAEMPIEALATEARRRVNDADQDAADNAYGILMKAIDD